jgi:hypothetical protein
VAGTALAGEEADAVVDVRVEQSAQVPTMATIRLRDGDLVDDPGIIASSTFALGKEVEVSSLDETGNATSVMKGKISSLGWDQRMGAAGGVNSDHELVVTVLDGRQYLTHGLVPKTYLNQTYGDVIGSLISDSGAGLSSNVATTGLMAVTHEYLMVTTNAFDFISDVCSRAGMTWWADASTVYVKPVKTDDQGVRLEYPFPLTAFKVQVAADRGDKSVEIRSDDPLSLEGIKSKTASAPEESSTAQLGADAVGSTEFVQDVISASLPTQTVNEAKALAEGIANQMAATQVIAKGEVKGFVEVEVGTAVEVASLPTPVGGKYFVTSCSWVWSGGRDVVTRFSASGTKRNTLVDLLATRPTAPSFADGLIHGIVTNVSDPENLGRVKVKMPSIADDEDSWWARVLSAGAGVESGLQAQHAINDHVMVAFERGDYRRPVVLGGMWTTNNPLPNPDLISDRVHGWALKSVSGNIIELLDEGGDADQAIHMTSADETVKVKFGLEGVSIDATSEALELKNDEGSIVIAANGDITIDGGKITITGSGEISIKSDADVKVDGANVKLNAKQNAEVKGTAGAKVESSAMTDIKGSMVNIN